MGHNSGGGGVVVVVVVVVVCDGGSSHGAITFLLWYGAVRCCQRSILGMNSESEIPRWSQRLPWTGMYHS